VSSTKKKTRRTIRLEYDAKRNNYNDPRNSDLSLCCGDLRRAFDIPDGTVVIWVSVSTKPVKDWDKITYEGYQDVGIKSMSGRFKTYCLSPCVLDWLADLLQAGRRYCSIPWGTPFWVKIEYEE